MKFILAKKLEMTQVYRPDGSAVPVTSSKRTFSRHSGQDQGKRTATAPSSSGFLPAKRLAKPQEGTPQGSPQARCPRGIPRRRHLCVEGGDAVEASVFAPNDEIDVTGTSKGKGLPGCREAPRVPRPSVLPRP